jgi:hypothetical protein
MNPVNRQYFEKAHLFGKIGLIGRSLQLSGPSEDDFSGSRNRNSFGSGHFN